MARAQFWELINRIRKVRPQMSVIVATAYMDEAQGFDWLAMMDDGQILKTGTSTRNCWHRTDSTQLEEAYIQAIARRKETGL